jgi:hypothetical protein
LLEGGASELEALIAIEQLRASAFGPKWRETLVALYAYCGLKGPAVSNMMVRFSALLVFSPAQIEAVERVLRIDIGLEPKNIRYILTKRPSLFATHSTAQSRAMIRRTPPRPRERLSPRWRRRKFA